MNIKQSFYSQTRFLRLFMCIVTAGCAHSVNFTAATSSNPYPDYKLFDGHVATSLFQNDIVFNEISFVAPGKERLACRGIFHGDYHTGQIVVPIVCNEDLHGTVDFGPNLTQPACYSGSFSLSNGYAGNLSFNSNKCVATG